MRLALAVALVSALLAAAEKKEANPPDLPMKHPHPSGKFTFNTPEGWIKVVSPHDQNNIEVSNGELTARYLFSYGEAGYDSLHVTCMLERLAPAMKQMPEVKYEYDFQMGSFGPFRVLDSAFVVTYDEPIGGHHAWRQRNLTIVGGGISLCVITYAPYAVWEESKQMQALVKAMAESVTFLDLGEEFSEDQRR